jgi:hypothetical protein
MLNAVAHTSCFVEEAARMAGVERLHNFFTTCRWRWESASTVHDGNGEGLTSIVFGVQMRVHRGGCRTVRNKVEGGRRVEVDVKVPFHKQSYWRMPCLFLKSLILGPRF